MKTPASSGIAAAADTCMGLRQHVLHTIQTADSGLFAYRTVRRILRFACPSDETPLVLSGLFSADLADLKTRNCGRRSFVVRPTAERDIPKLAAYFGPGRPIDARLRRGDICLAAFSGEEIGAAVWFAFGPQNRDEDSKDLGCSLQFPAGTTFSYDGKGTRMGAWGTLMMRAPQLLEDLGIQRIATLIDYENALSIRSHLSLGYRRLGYLGCLKLGRWAQPFYSVDSKTWRMLPGRMGPVCLRRTGTSRKNAPRNLVRRALGLLRTGDTPGLRNWRRRTLSDAKSPTV